MSQIEPKNSEDLSQTYFGEIPYQYSGKSSVLTQGLDLTYYGVLMAGNDWILGGGGQVSLIKKANGLLFANLKKENGLLETNIKKANGLTNV